jgi:hypothetical protein
MGDFTSTRVDVLMNYAADTTIEVSQFLLLFYLSVKCWIILHCAYDKIVKKLQKIPVSNN